MSDIVKRLRKRAPHWNVIDAENMLEGAARIEALEAENRQLRAALAEQDEAAVYVPTVVSWSGGPMPFATIRVRLDETPTEYEYVPAHNTAEQAQPVAWAEQIVEHLTALHNTEMIRELDSGDALIRLDDAIAGVDEARDRYTPPPAPQPLTELPPLPAPVRQHDGQPLFGAGQMRDYARAVEAEVLKRVGVQR